MPLTVRPMERKDCGPLAEMLNHTIALGGTTAYEEPFSEAGFAEEFLYGDIVSSLVAEADGQPVGFQVLIAYDAVDRSKLAIATFADQRTPKPGVGTALMAATKARARQLGCAVIVAKIRADNASGLPFYAKHGFVEVDRQTGIPLNDGTPVDRVITECRLG